jgi:cytoskeleton protein RodZ
MSSIGETLRREREKRKLDLDQVSRELKISTRFLEAIETENFDRLPGGVFAKSFVLQYARMLDLDEEEIAAEVQRTLSPFPLRDFAATVPKAAAPQTVEFAPRVDSISSRPFASGSWLPALALVVAVMLGCSFVYGWWQRDRRQASAPPPHRVVTAQAANAAPASTTPALQVPGPPAEAAATTLPPPATALQTPVTSAAAETAPARRPAQAQPEPASPAPPVPQGAVKVEIATSDEPVWVLARTDGKYAFSGTLEKNETRTVNADGVVLLRLGNAGGVVITLNGKPIPAVGPKGQVRTVQLTSGGFQIVARPKPSAPDTPL